MPTPFMYAGTRHMMPHPKPVRRKTSALDGYYKDGNPVATAYIGDTLTWNVPGYPTGWVYLVQYNNGQPGYNKEFWNPMAPYTLSEKDHTGLVQNTVYDKNPAQGGAVIETDSIYVYPRPTAQQGTTSSGSGGSSTTTVTTGGSGGGTAAAPAADNTGLWLAIAAAVAFLMIA